MRFVNQLMHACVLHWREVLPRREVMQGVVCRGFFEQVAVKDAQAPAFFVPDHVARQPRVRFLGTQFVRVKTASRRRLVVIDLDQSVWMGHDQRKNIGESATLPPPLMAPLLAHIAQFVADSFALPRISLLAMKALGPFDSRPELPTVRVPGT